MNSSQSLEPVITFLTDLRENNNKAWFDRNRARYEDARQAFEELVEYFIAELSKVQDLRGVSARECIFRINRDIRFAKDKSPYKTNLAAEIAPGGRNSPTLGYYLHIAPQDGSMVAGGVYMPTSVQLSKFREAMARDAAKFKRLTKDREFIRYFGAVEGERLSTAPQGYSRDHPEIDLLRLKQVLVVHRFTDKQLLARNFRAEALKVMKAMTPFTDYLNRILT